MPKLMSKSKLVTKIAEKTGVSKKKAALLFGELFKLAVRESKRAGRFVIPNIGWIVVVHGKTRMGRNPQTGEAIKVRSRRVVRMRPSKALKQHVLKANGWPD